MKSFVLDFRNVNNFEEVHNVLMKAFDFPEYYGKNLDALNDCLSEKNILDKIYIIRKRNIFKGFNRIIEVFKDNNIELEQIIVK
ncbi:MAG: barstar family protein [Lachnospiraceae bacterium]|nr:barstar family protein [Lachnospiraceae bacterium]